MDDTKWTAYFFLNHELVMFANNADYAINSEGETLWETAKWRAEHG